jgi:hypothetical protein
MSLHSEARQQVQIITLPRGITMSKYTIAGLVSFLASGIILGFQTISSLMDPSATSITKKKTAWKNLTLADSIGQEYFVWIDSISWTSIQSIADYIVDMPLYLLLLCIGILCFIINAFRSRM